MAGIRKAAANALGGLNLRSKLGRNSSRTVPTLFIFFAQHRSALGRIAVISNDRKAAGREITYPAFRAYRFGRSLRRRRREYSQSFLSGWRLSLRFRAPRPSDDPS